MPLKVTALKSLVSNASSIDGVIGRSNGSVGGALRVTLPPMKRSLRSPTVMTTRIPQWKRVVG